MAAAVVSQRPTLPQSAKITQLKPRQRHQSVVQPRKNNSGPLHFASPFPMMVGAWGDSVPGVCASRGESAATLQLGRPMVSDTKSKHRKIMEKAAAVVATMATRPQCGVLVVEDDPDLQWRLARMLTIEGHRVVGTSSGEGALALVSQWPVDLVLVDEHLPGMDGIEVARRLGVEHPSIPVVLMTVDDDPQVRAAAATAGAIACLPKPFRAETLLALLSNVTTLSSSPGE